MLYMLLIYGDENRWASLSEEELAASMPEWTEYTAWLKEKGWYLAGDALRETAHATTVALKDGKRVVTDGPFAETKEQFGGFYIFNVRDLDRVLEMAARVPLGPTDCLEIRPLQEV